MEFLCTAPPKVVRQLVDSLAPAQVHVVWTARDLTKVLPAAWQTLLRNKQAPTWPDYVDSVRRSADSGGPQPRAEQAAARPGRRDAWGHRFWRQQDPRQALAPYLEHLPAERVHVVTVPPSGSPPELLWQRFSAAVGLDPEAYDIDVPRANTSLGGVECEVLRRVNEQIAGRIQGSSYNELVKFFLAREVLERRAAVVPAGAARERAGVGGRARGRRGGVPVRWWLHAARRPRRPGRLRPRRVPSVREPDDVTDTELLAVTQDTLAQVLLEMSRRQGRSRARHGVPPPEDPTRTTWTTRTTWQDAEDPEGRGEDPEDAEGRAEEPVRPRRGKGRKRAAGGGGGRGGQGRGRGRSSPSA